MQIMCLNGWGGKLHAELLSFLSSAAPDILCLQEVVHSPDSDKGWLTYRDGDHVLPQRARLFNEICEVLRGHNAVFCPAARGILWDNDRPVQSQFGLATFVRRSFPIIGQMQGFVYKTFSPYGFGEHPRGRNAHAVRVYDYERGRPVSITHMHGLRDLNGKMDTPERAQQASRLLEISRAVCEPDDVSVICGDFNVAPGSETLGIFENAGMVELVLRHGFTSTRTSYYKKPGQFADYMLINREDRVKKFEVVRYPEVSDHCPLVLEL